MPNFPITNAYRERYLQGGMGQPQGQPQGVMPHPNPQAMQHANPNARFMRPQGPQMPQQAQRPMGVGQPGFLPQPRMMQPPQGQPMNPYMARLMAFRGQ